MTENKIESVYQIIKKDPIEKDAYWSLLINEHLTKCPFAQPLPLQTSMGNSSLYTRPCSTSCPLAEIIYRAGENIYRTHCNGVVREFNVTILEDKKKNPLIAS